MSITVDWLMRAPAREIAKKALGSLDKHAKTDAERLELMTNIIMAVREAAHASAFERLEAFLERPVLYKSEVQISEIKITSEMVSAGFDALKSIDSRDYPDRVQVIDVFTSMIEVATLEWLEALVASERSRRAQ